jgi:hypothetical protein
VRSSFITGHSKMLNEGESHSSHTATCSFLGREPVLHRHISDSGSANSPLVKDALVSTLGIKTAASPSYHLATWVTVRVLPCLRSLPLILSSICLAAFSRFQKSW